MNLFSDEMRRDPYPAYAHLRTTTPVLHVPQFDAWLLFDYESVRRALSDHAAFSSSVPAPPWFIFDDPPRHTKLRALITRAFTPRTVAGLEPRIRELSRELLDPVMTRGAIDLAAEYAIPLPMMVIAELIGIPVDERPTFNRWSSGILALSYSLFRGEEAERAVAEFRAVTAEMAVYLEEMIRQRLVEPRDDLLTRLIQAEVDGERLAPGEILGFFQLLLVGGQETTTNLINSAMLCFMEHPDQLARLRAAPELLASAIEEVLRYRSPLQWIMRTPRHDVEVHGHVIPAGKLVLAVIGSANRDPAVFLEPERFDITRDPNPHVAFGHGIHFCLGAALARLEGRIALADLLTGMVSFSRASDVPWEPRRALHVHGPASLPIRFQCAWKHHRSGLND